MKPDVSHSAGKRPSNDAAVDPRPRDLARVLGRVIARRRRQRHAERRKADRQGGEDVHLPKEAHE